MEKQQTVMQELLEFCEYRQTKAADSCKASWNMILAKIKDDGLLEREKEQIIDAHLTGLIHPLEMEATKQATEYYNETYKNK
jgi:hypothetical protein